jgi:hypothetical protein
MLTKVHSSILHIHGLVGEKECAKWLSDSQKAAVSLSQPVKTPTKKPSTRRKAPTAAAANAEQTEEAAEEGSSAGVQREVLKETMRFHYTHLIEMDELIREKLFILQVREKILITSSITR